MHKNIFKFYKLIYNFANLVLINWLCNLIKISEVMFICFLSSMIIFYIIYFKNEFSFGYAPLQAGMEKMAHEVMEDKFMKVSKFKFL